MTGARKTEAIKVFLDSSIFIAATLSISGGSFRLCKEGNERKIILITNRYVVDEVREVLLRKYPDNLESFESLLKWSKAEIEKYPTKKSVETAARFLDDKDDAPILAGAVSAKVHFLATLDNDFFTEMIKSAPLSLIILKPRTFFQAYF